jgi:polyhydroxybutyrate depolymerase
MRSNLLTRTLVAATWLSAAVSVQAQAMHFTIDGVERQAFVLAPANASRSTQKLPLLFAFHGHGGNMVQTAAQMRFDKVWPTAIVVYMQGLRTATNGDPDGYETGWQQESGQFDDRDLRFFDAVLVDLRKAFPVDDNRVYATGFSNGGIFTYLLWGTRAKVFAALAPVATAKSPGVQLAVPMPLLQIGGEQDMNFLLPEQLKSMAIAREVNGTGAGHSCGEYCTTYDSSRGAPVITYIHPGGHVYPREASQMIVDFFKQHRRAETSR